MELRDEAPGRAGTKSRKIFGGFSIRSIDANAMPRHTAATTTIDRRVCCDDGARSKISLIEASGAQGGAQSRGNPTYLLEEVELPGGISSARLNLGSNAEMNGGVALEVEDATENEGVEVTEEEGDDIEGDPAARGVVGSFSARPKHTKRPKQSPDDGGVLEIQTSHFPATSPHVRDRIAAPVHPSTETASASSLLEACPIMSAAKVTQTDTTEMKEALSAAAQTDASEIHGEVDRLNAELVTCRQQHAKSSAAKEAELAVLRKRLDGILAQITAVGITTIAAAAANGENSSGGEKKMPLQLERLASTSNRALDQELVERGAALDEREAVLVAATGYDIATLKAAVTTILAQGKLTQTNTEEKEEEEGEVEETTRILDHEEELEKEDEDEWEEAEEASEKEDGELQQGTDEDEAEEASQGGEPEEEEDEYIPYASAFTDPAPHAIPPPTTRSYTRSANRTAVMIENETARNNPIELDE